MIGKRMEAMITILLISSLILSGITLNNDSVKSNEIEKDQQTRAPTLLNNYTNPNYPIGHTTRPVYSDGTGGSIIEIVAELQEVPSPLLWYQWCIDGICRPAVEEAMTNMGGNMFSYTLDGTDGTPASSDGSFPANCTIHYKIKLDRNTYTDTYYLYVFWPPGDATVDAAHLPEVFPEDSFWVNGTVEYNSTDKDPLSHSYGEHAMMENSDVTVDFGGNTFDCMTNRTGHFSTRVDAPSKPGNYDLNITAENSTWNVKGYYESQVTVVGLDLTGKSNVTSTLPGRSVKVNGTANLTNGDIPEGADVTIELNNTYWNTTVDTNGYYENILTVPNETGNHTIRINVTYEKYSLSNEIQIAMSVTNVSKPEISISNLVTDPINPHEGMDVDVISTITNTGTASADFNVSLSLDSQNNIIDWKSLSLTVGSTSDLVFQWSAESGSHELWVTVDPNGTLGEDDNDNSISIDIDVIELNPKISLSELSLTPLEDIFEDDVVKVYTTLNNSGNEETSVEIAFAVDQKENKTMWIEELIGVDEEKDVMISWEAIAGEHTLWFIVDPNGTLENNVIDGEKKITLSVGRRIAEIFVGDMIIDPLSPSDIGQRVYLTTTVSNLGNKQALFDIGLAVDYKSEVESWTRCTLASEESMLINMSFRTTNEQHLIWMIADYNDTVYETVESDNTVGAVISQLMNTDDDSDTDGDGITDGLEREYEMDILDPTDAKADFDGDGLPNIWEINKGLDIYDPKDADKDSDNDGFSNLEEYEEGTDPMDSKDKPFTFSLSVIVLSINMSVGIFGIIFVLFMLYKSRKVYGEVSDKKKNDSENKETEKYESGSEEVKG